MAIGPDLGQQIDRVVVELTSEFADRFQAELVQEHVMRVYRRLAGSRISTFIPVLTKRQARQALLQRNPGGEPMAGLPWRRDPGSLQELPLEPVLTMRAVRHERGPGPIVPGDRQRPDR